MSATRSGRVRAAAVVSLGLAGALGLGPVSTARGLDLCVSEVVAIDPEAVGDVCGYLSEGGAHASVALESPLAPTLVLGSVFCSVDDRHLDVVAGGYAAGVDLPPVYEDTGISC